MSAGRANQSSSMHVKGKKAHVLDPIVDRQYCLHSLYNRHSSVSKDRPGHRNHSKKGLRTLKNHNASSSHHGEVAAGYHPSVPFHQAHQVFPFPPQLPMPQKRRYLVMVRCSLCIPPDPISSTPTKKQQSRRRKEKHGKTHLQPSMPRLEDRNLIIIEQNLP